MISRILNGDPLEELEFRQHDRPHQCQGPALIPDGIAEFDLNVAGDQFLRLDVARNDQARLRCQDIQVAQGLKVIPAISQKGSKELNFSINYSKNKCTFKRTDLRKRKRRSHRASSMLIQEPKPLSS